MKNILKHTRIKAGILTVSDRASAGVYQDISGPAIKNWLERAVLSPHDVIMQLTPDDKNSIAQSLIYLCDAGCDLVFTTGGTGPAAHDVTPEATVSVCERILAGFGEHMRRVSMQEVPTAILSRQTAGTRGKTAIINLPGKPDAISVCLSAIFLAVPKLLELLSNINVQIDLNFIEGSD